MDSHGLLRATAQPWGHLGVRLRVRLTVHAIMAGARMTVLYARAEYEGVHAAGSLSTNLHCSHFERLNNQDSIRRRRRAHLAFGAAGRMACIRRPMEANGVTLGVEHFARVGDARAARGPGNETMPLLA